VKVLHAALTDQASFVHQFQREAEVLQQLTHPHIIQYYASGQWHDRYYIVMEYLAGLTLRAMLRERKRLVPAEAVWLAWQTAEALAYATETVGLIHGDLKPENLFITADGCLKVLDFGFAWLPKGTDSSADPSLEHAWKEFSSSPTRLEATAVPPIRQWTGQGFVSGLMGTLDYMAPEQLLGKKPFDTRIDVYALGVCLFQMLTGALPYQQAQTFEELLVAHGEQNPFHLDDFLYDPHPQLVSVVERALAVAPEERWPTMQEFGSALQALLQFFRWGR
jgi:serine/threonine-protein kinase